MSNNALTQTIVTGSDPRALPEFSAIREEINKANHPSQPELNWKLVESLALSIFKANGVDLHTATYYTLARTRNQGLAGFCEGAELLAAMIIHEWDKFWPQSGPARTEMLDWFNTRTGNILRQQVSFSENDLFVALPHGTGFAAYLRQTPASETEAPAARGKSALFCAEHTQAV